MLSGLFLVAAGGDYSLVAVCGLLTAVASLALEHRPQGMRASVAAGCRLVVVVPGSRAQAQWLRSVSLVSYFISIHCLESRTISIYSIKLSFLTDYSL